MPWAPKKANAVAGLAQRGEGTSSTPRKEAAALVCPHRLPRLPFPGFRYALLIEISETDAPLRVIPGTKVFTGLQLPGKPPKLQSTPYKKHRIARPQARRYAEHAHLWTQWFGVFLRGR